MATKSNCRSLDAAGARSRYLDLLGLADNEDLVAKVTHGPSPRPS